MSYTYYKTMIEGSRVEHSQTADSFFKEKYNNFNKKWEKNFGWRLYKPLANEDQHYFTALHVPTTDNVKSFCEQTLAIVKLTIDRLNDAELGKLISVESGDKRITKFEKFLATKDIRIPDMFVF